MNDYSLKNLILTTLVLKIGLFLAIVVGLHFFSVSEKEHPNFTLRSWDSLNFVHQAEKISVLRSFGGWDSSLYIYLAKYGYPQNRAFVNNLFPLLPAVIQVFVPLFGKSYELCGLVLCNIFSLIGIIFIYLLIRKLFDSRIAFISCILLLTFPGSFYLHLIYSESLFLALIGVFFYCLYSNKLIWALATGFFMPIARPQGILMLIPTVIFILSKSPKKDVKRYLIPLAIILGYGCYLWFMKVNTGSCFSTLTAHYPNYSIGHLLDPWQWFINNFVSINLDFHGWDNSFINRLFFVLLLPCFILYKRLDLTLLSYAVVMFFVIAFIGDFGSYLRHLIIVFPLFVLIALKWGEKSYLLAIGMFCTQIVLLLAHMVGIWVA